MKRKARVTWKLMISFLMFIGLLGTAIWLLQALPAQAAPNLKPVTAVSANVSASSVTLAGDLQNELGCSVNWQPECTATHLNNAGYGVWRGSFPVPNGDWNYKMALNDSWTDSYPGGNKAISVTIAPTETVFYFF